MAAIVGFKLQAVVMRYHKRHDVKQMDMNGS